MIGDKPELLKKIKTNNIIQFEIFMLIFAINDIHNMKNKNNYIII